MRPPPDLPPYRWQPATAAVSWDDRDAIVFIRGEIDCASTAMLGARLAEVAARMPRRVVLDLSGVTFMDCSGITEVIRLQRMLPAGRPVVLRSPSRQVRRLLRLTHLDEVCTIQDLPRGGAPRARGRGTVARSARAG